MRWPLSWHSNLAEAEELIIELRKTIELQASTVVRLRAYISVLEGKTSRRCASCGQFRSKEPFKSYAHHCSTKKQTL